MVEFRTDQGLTTLLRWLAAQQKKPSSMNGVLLRVVKREIRRALSGAASPLPDSFEELTKRGGSRTGRIRGSFSEEEQEFLGRLAAGRTRSEFIRRAILRTVLERVERDSDAVRDAEVAEAIAQMRLTHPVRSVSNDEDMAEMFDGLLPEPWDAASDDDDKLGPIERVGLLADRLVGALSEIPTPTTEEERRALEDARTSLERLASDLKRLLQS